MPKQLILQFLEVRSPGGRNRSSTESLTRPKPGASRAEFLIGGSGGRIYSKAHSGCWPNSVLYGLGCLCFLAGSQPERGLCS